MRRAFGVVVAGALGVALLSGASEAGWIVRGQHKSGGGDRVSTETTYFDRNKVRSESEGHASVMDFAARRIIWIDAKEKTYVVMTFDEFKKMMRETMAKANQAMEEMKKAGIAVPGQPARPRGKVAVARIEGASIAGYSCEGYRITVGGTETEKVWVARKFAPMGEIDKSWAREFDDLMREMRKMGPAADPAEDDPAYRKVHEGGFPMRSIDAPTRGVQEVTSVEKRTLEASLFGEPAGYRKRTFEEMFGGLSEEGIPAARKRTGRTGTKMPKAPATEEEASGLPAAPAGAPPAAGVGGEAADLGKRQADDAADAAKRGATQPFEEKKGEGLDAIKEGVSGGIKKLFKW